MVNRPLINTRDEPHANDKLYRRLHVIVGDSNMSELSIYLKAGITSIVLQLIEKGVVGKKFSLKDPVAAIIIRVTRKGINPSTIVSNGTLRDMR